MAVVKNQGYAVSLKDKKKLKALNSIEHETEYCTCNRPDGNVFCHINVPVKLFFH